MWNENERINLKDLSKENQLIGLRNLKKDLKIESDTAFYPKSANNILLENWDKIRIRNEWKDLVKEMTSVYQNKRQIGRENFVFRFPPRILEKLQKIAHENDWKLDFLAKKIYNTNTTAHNSFIMNSISDFTGTIFNAIPDLSSQSISKTTSFDLISNGMRWTC